MDISVERYSSFTRLLRVTAWCLKLLKQMVWNKATNSRSLLSSNIQNVFMLVTDAQYISANDIKAAERVWIFHVQDCNFHDIKQALQHNKPHSLVKQLDLQIDNYGVILCRGRFKHADVNLQAAEPILLAKKDRVTQLIIKDAHEASFHSGVGHTLSQLRQRFWIPQGRAAVRTVVSRCSLCQRYKGAPFALPPMPPWPRERVSRSSPFEFTGLDYLGPVTVRVEGDTKKMWICLFTCLAVRAIHLEIVTDCSAKEFLQCLIRFISRRGTPTQIISDNAPQFRVTKTVFDRVWHEILSDESVQSFAANKKILWKFTTELAPWQGGFYERLVGLVKAALRAAVGRRLVAWGELLTLASQVEAIINSRPITYVYSDFTSGFCLRPIDFITDLPVNLPVSGSAAKSTGAGDAGKDLINMWKIKQNKLNSLWDFWTKEYLLSLRERYQRLHKRTKGEHQTYPKVGDIVVVRDTDLPRAVWKLGRITEIIFGNDNQVRSAQLQLPNGTYIKRPLNHLFPLEMDSPPQRIHSNGDNQSPDGSDDEFLGFTEEEVNEAMARCPVVTNSQQNISHLIGINLEIAPVKLEFHK